MSNPFAGMNQTSTSKSGRYLKEGKYELDIKKCVYLDTDDNRAFIAEMQVTESSNPDIELDGERSWFQKVNKSFKAEVKSFCYALLGYDETKPEDEKFIRDYIDGHSEAIMNKALEFQWPTKAQRKISVECFNKQQREDKSKTFTKHIFRPAKGSTKITKEQIAQILALK